MIKDLILIYPTALILRFALFLWLMAFFNEAHATADGVIERSLAPAFYIYPDVPIEVEEAIESQTDPCFEECGPNDTHPPGILVDLRQPVYSEGVLSTEYGGVITAPGLRIQAQQIVYSRKSDNDSPVCTIFAQGNLILEFGDYVFIGESLEYDFNAKTGIIYNGRTMVEPWFFGGERVFLYPDGSYSFDQAFVTTSENVKMDWQILAQTAVLTPTNRLHAYDVRFKIFRLPVFWLPSFHVNLNSIFDGPIRYSVKWGGSQGHRFGAIYEVFSWNRLKAFLRLDYRLRRGLGGGLETTYRSEDHKTAFQTINYVARDSSIIHPSQRLRYRFQGVGDTMRLDDKLSVHLSYDKLSDIDMATDYNDRGLELDTAGRTELVMRRQEDRWIANLISRLRINNFQSVKQELPTFETSWHPAVLGSTGIVSSMVMKAAYLDFAYGNNILNARDYSATRLELAPEFYRPFTYGNVNITPEAGGILIAYGNSPKGTAEWLTLAKLGLDINTSLYRHFFSYKHVITPYVKYDYYSMPTVSPNHHYIFDIEDGWYRLNMMQMGISQSLYKKEGCCISRKIYASLYANAFFDTHTFPSTIPKVYADLVFNTLPSFRHIINTAWDFNHNELDHYNVRTEWTISADTAIALEYRHRSPWDWRKVDHTNFILDSFRTLSELYHSQVSDRRDTLLLHFFCRFHPSWALEVESRHGWNRRFEPAYNEFEIDLIGNLRSAWNVRFSYQHKEDDDRVSVYMNIGIKRPDCERSQNLVPCLSY